MPAAPPNAPSGAPARHRLPTGALLRWYRAHARDLPWRNPGTDPWAVLVSEVMLQQTPVARVLPAYRDWLARWPSPQALAAEPAGEAVRAWSNLGYPRRALRLHAAAVAVTRQHGGVVPADPAALRELPGVGGYTAAAVAAFAYGQRVAVLDTNVRRVIARHQSGVAQPAGSAPAAAEVAAVTALLPLPPAAARVSVALMELGALVCTARSPGCAGCPLAAGCRWRAAGRPAPAHPRPRQPAYAGSDRQARGRLLAVLRAAEEPVPATALTVAWPHPEQRRRALAGLCADGLAVRAAGGGYALPG